ncbi:TPA: acylphosphatase [Methanocaldococcus jannaschii]|nr:acylphosphatase [Methanocaldococcus jannaschii]HII59539.1 acylphosphatase [Methanocaldococcus jannaschii]
MATTYELRIYGNVECAEFIDKVESLGKLLDVNGVVYVYKDSVRILANFPNEKKRQLFKEIIKDLEDDGGLIKVERIEERDLNTYIEFPNGLNKISTNELKEINKKLDKTISYLENIFNALEKQIKVSEEIRDILKDTFEV